MSAPRLAAVIEIGLDARGEVPVDLVEAAYLASREGTVVLVLNGVSTKQVDRALDPVVARVTGVAGVVYCTPSSLDELLRQRGRPRVASIGTGTLAWPRRRRGARVLPPDRVLPALRQLGGGRRVSPTRGLPSKG